MASANRPAGVGGKSLDALNPNNDAPGENAPSRAESVAPPQAPSETELIYARNTARETRNKARAARRAANEDPVSDDEEPEMPVEARISVDVDPVDLEEERGDSLTLDLVEADTEATAATPLEKERLATLNRILALSPGTMKVALSCLAASSTLVAPPTLGAPTKHAPDAAGDAPSRLIMDVLREGNLFKQRVEAHPSLAALLTNGHHLPLTLCTTAALTEMQSDPTRVKYAKLHDRLGVKKELLDVSSWPAERGMSIEEWRDAHRNLAAILRSCGSKEVVDLFESHFNSLCERSEIISSNGFQAILRFDIEIRHSFFCGRREAFRPGSSPYEKRFDQVAREAMEERLSAPIQTQNQSHSNRYQPYQKNHNAYTSGNVSQSGSSSTGKPEKGSGSQGRPPGHFQGGRRPDGPAAACLICGRTGHRASICSKTTHSSGKAVFCTWRDNKLLEIASQKELCVIWNVGGRTPCGSYRCPIVDSPHACSYCGSADHHAHSNRCISA